MLKYQDCDHQQISISELARGDRGGTNDWTDFNAGECIIVPSFHERNPLKRDQWSARYCTRRGKIPVMGRFKTKETIRPSFLCTAWGQPPVNNFDCSIACRFWEVAYTVDSLQIADFKSNNANALKREHRRQNVSKSSDKHLYKHTDVVRNRPCVYELVLSSWNAARWYHWRWIGQSLGLSLRAHSLADSNTTTLKESTYYLGESRRCYEKSTSRIYRVVCRGHGFWRVEVNLPWRYLHSDAEEND